MRHHIHHVPGRVRVRTTALKKNGPRAAQVVDVLRQLPAVTSAEANLLTGSVTVYYDRTVADLGLLTQALREQCGVSIEALPDAKALVPAPSARRVNGSKNTAQSEVFNAVARSAALFLIEKAVEQALLALLAGLL